MTEGTVVSVDFGKANREHGRRLARLVGAIEKQWQELIDDPRRLYDMAEQAIVARNQLIARHRRRCVGVCRACTIQKGPSHSSPCARW